MRSVSSASRRRAAATASTSSSRSSDAHLRGHARVRRDRRRHARADAPRAGHHRVDEGEAPRRPDRREPERRGEDDRVGLLGAAAPGRARLGAAALGRGTRGPRPARLHDGRRPAPDRAARRPVRGRADDSTVPRRGSSIAPVKLTELVAELDDYFRIPDVRGDDWSPAFDQVYADDPYWREYVVPGWEGHWNGLSLRGAEEVERVATCVFPSDRIVAGARAGDVPLLRAPARLRRRAGLPPALVETYEAMRENGISFYNAHAPLDMHPEVSPSRMCSVGAGLENLDEYFPICEGIPGGAAIIGDSRADRRGARRRPALVPRPGDQGARAHAAPRRGRPGGDGRRRGRRWSRSSRRRSSGAARPT